MVGFITYDQYIKMVEEESKWTQIKKFVNETKSFRHRDIPLGSTGYVYVNYLHKAGFLSRPKKGHYLLNLNIEDDITLHNITEYAYGDKKGTLNKLIRKKKIEKINGI